MPKVSILLTSYNHADYVGESIESILNQTYKDFELYIVDDCSTDDSWDVIKKYKDKRIITIKHKKNMGKCLTKELIKKFKGEYIAIAHCDDKWEKTKLEKQVKYLDKNKNVGACFTHVKLIDEQGNELDNTNEKKYTNFNVKNQNRYKWLNYFFTKGNKFCHPSVLLRKSVQVKEDLNVYGLGALPDLYRWIKLLLKYDVHIINEKLTLFRVRVNGINTSGRNRDNTIRNYFDVYHLLDLYKSIENKDEFLKVFPEAKKYVINNKIDIEYSFAKICLETEHWLEKSYKLYGLNLLFELLQDDKRRKKIEKEYGYTARDLKTDAGKYDFFNAIKKESFMNISIYYGTNESFDENNKVSQEVYTTIEGDFYVMFKNLKNNIKKIRIDLDEDVYRSYRSLEIKINGVKQKIKMEDCYKTRNELIVLTVDPKIYIEVKEKINTIEIKGNARVIPLVEMENINKRLNNKKIKFFINNLINRKRW